MPQRVATTLGNLVAALFLILTICLGACRAGYRPVADGKKPSSQEQPPLLQQTSETQAPTPQKPALHIENVVIHNEFSEQVRSTKVLDSMWGQRGVGLVRDEHRHLPRLERPQNREFHLGPNKPFAPYLLLSNNTDNPQIHLISAVVDYRQISFTLDRKEGMLHEVSVPPGTELEIPVSLAIAGEGMHDVLFLEMSRPYNATLDIDERMSTVNETFGTRAIVFVGNEEAPARSLDYLTNSASAIPKGIEYNPPIHFAEASLQTEIHPAKRQLYVAQTPPGETYSFQVRITNESKRPVEYLFIPLFNYRQVSVNGKDVWAVRLGAKEEIVVDVALPLPEEEGIHLFEMVYIYDPYRSLLQERVQSPFIKSSERLAFAILSESE